MNESKITLRLPRDDLAVIRIAAKKAGLSVNRFVIWRALGDAHEAAREARTQAAIETRLAENSERIAEAVGAGRGEILGALEAMDGRMEKAFSQLHAAIVGAKK